MKRAFLFSVIFILLFTIFLLLSVFYLNILQMNELNLAQTRNITQAIYTLDDIRSDLLDYLQLSVKIGSNSTHTIINISDTLPSPYTNPSTELGNYKSFISGMYSNQTNSINSSNLSVISLTTTSFESAPSIQFINSNSSLNLNYTYTSLNKNQLIVNGSSAVTNYSIAINLSKTCFNNNCTSAALAGGPPNADSSTAGLWHFDEGSGTAVSDASGNGNTGALSGSQNPTWVGGRFGSGLQFTYGVTNQVVVNDSDSLDMSSNFTVELWFNQSTGSTGLAPWLLNKDNSTSLAASNYQVWMNIAQYLFVTIGNGTVSQSIGSTSIIQANTWYHVAFTADGTNLKLYINGVLENSTNQNTTPAPNSQPLLIGARRTSMLGNRFDGTIDEVAIYSRAKSADEIAADANIFHWDWGPIAMNNNLSAAWHFDEGSGNSSQDISGNQNMINFTGTIQTTMAPSSVNKAYSINLTSSDNPLLATTEMNYSKLTASDSNYETSYTSYSNTFTMDCQNSGACTCKGGSRECWSPDMCINYGGCVASCPSAANASTSSTCTQSAYGCSVTCSSCEV